MSAMRNGLLALLVVSLSIALLGVAWPKKSVPVPARMIEIPAGEFLSGPARQPVTLPTFYIDEYEVTNAQYRAFVEATGWKGGLKDRWRAYAEGRDDYPVAGVSWSDAAAYAMHDGKRLPTILEWEKSCRGPQGRRYPWGDEWRDGAANVNSADAAPVDSFPQDVSVYGVRGLAGNVYEWTATPFRHEASFLLEGGGWPCLPRTAELPVSMRGTTKAYCIGFRCAWP